MISAPQYRVMSDRAALTTLEDRVMSRYGVVFNSDSYPLYIETEDGEYVRVIERITPESITNADMDDLICARNHDFDQVLGRTSNRTMKVEIDDTGIKYTTRICKTYYGDATIENVKRNDIEGSSFVFMFDVAKGYEFEQRDNGDIIASPKEITKFIEMGPVTKPAYPGTIQNRSDELATAVRRFLKDQNDGEKKVERSEAKEQKKTEKKESEPEARAMDVMDLVELVSSAFYRQFDGEDDMYYYVQSIAVDNTLVVKEYPTRKLWRVGFEISDANEVTFSDRSEWVQVKKEYLPITSARIFYDAKNEAKQNRDQEGSAGAEHEPEYPRIPAYIAKARVMKAKNKRV